AASELELSLALRPEVPVLYHELTKAYISGNNLQQAASVMNKMLEKYPLSEEGYITLGDIFAQRGDWLRANRAYDKAFTLNPNHPFIAKRKNLVKENIEVKKEEKERIALSVR
ncbi:MAG: tetratricopeptide repeat protein, partial [Candidatus Jordarchaeaceae archaeon]